MTTRRTNALAVAALAALVAVGVACEPGEPPPPPPQFAITSTADAPDADPGDGTCEATSGLGDCTLRAGIDEGNALGRADLLLPEATHDLAGPVEVTGTIHVLGQGRFSRVGGSDVFDDRPLHVAAGGFLRVEDVNLWAVAVQVDGTFLVLRSEVATWGSSGGSGSGVTVAPGGAALVQSSWIGTMDSPALTNRGLLMVDLSTIGSVYEYPTPTSPDGGFDLGGITTDPGASTHLRGTWIASPWGCQGDAPASMGFNAAVNTSCQLSGPGDRQDAPGISNDGGVVVPATGPLVDAIPLGSIGCGVVSPDLRGTARPLDGDGDGTAACDIGAVELPAP